MTINPVSMLEKQLITIYEAYILLLHNIEKNLLGKDELNTAYSEYINFFNHDFS
jgi:hypothetical protein